MTRGRGGFIGTNVVPAAAGINSAASGLWTLRDQESLKRAGTWPTAFISPTQLTGLQLWLDAADASTLYDATTGGSLVAADGGVARWEDKSGNSRHATQSTPDNRPLRKTAIINSRDAITFDGTNDYLILPSSTVAFGSSNFEWFIVTRSRAPTGPQAFVVVQDNTNSFAPIFRTMISGGKLLLTVRTDNGVAIDIDDAATYSSNSLIMFGARRASSTITATKNGTAFGSSAISNSFGATSVTPGVGAYIDNTGVITWFLDGDICEIIAYDSALSAANRAVVESYLMSKWGIT
jgi:hypothetical protein